MARPIILLTGATGFLGRHIAERLAGEPVELHAVARRVPAKGDDRVHWHEGDLLQPQTPATLIERIRPTHLLNNAWMAVPGQFWTHQDNVRWLHATARLLEAFAASGGRHFVGVGTCAEYDWTAGQFREDETPLRPATLYGKTKAAAWAIAESHASAGDFTAAWGRVFLPYGPGDSDGRLLPSLVDELSAGRTMRLGDGSVERDFIFAPDAADILTRLLIGGITGAFNVGSGRPVALSRAIDFVAERLGGSALLRYNSRPAPVGEPHRLVADTSKLETRLGWRAATPLEAGLEAFLADRLEDGAGRLAE